MIESAFIKLIAAILACILFFYLCGAFVQVSFNIADWTESTRGGVVTAAVTCIAICCFVYGVNRGS